MGPGCIKGGDSVITTSAGSGCGAVDGPAPGSAIEFVGGVDDARTSLIVRRHVHAITLNFHSVVAMGNATRKCERD